MRSWLVLALLLAAVAALISGPAAQAGLNAGAHVKMNWGVDFNDMVTDATIPDSTSDHQLTLYLSAIGLASGRGLDCSLIVLADRPYGGPLALPPAWQFQAGGGGCANNQSRIAVHIRNAANAALASVPDPFQVNFGGMYFGTPSVYQPMNGLWFLWAQASGPSGISLDRTTRYGLVEFVMNVPGHTSCAGGEPLTPICIGPSLRIGYPQIEGVVLGMFDANGDEDFLPFDPGFDHVTANYTGAVGINGCPAPTGVRVTTWGRLKRLYH